MHVDIMCSYKYMFIPLSRSEESAARFWNSLIMTAVMVACRAVSEQENVSRQPYDARFLFKFWATGQWKIGECAIVFKFSVYMLSLSFLVSVLSFSNQKPCVTSPMSILYISPMTDKKPRIISRSCLTKGQQEALQSGLQESKQKIAIVMSRV